MPADDTFLYELARDAEELKLIEYLSRSDQPRIRYRAAELLGGLAAGRSPETNERISRALVRTAKRDPVDAVRASAIDALYLRDEDTLDRLIDALADGGLEATPEWTDERRVVDWLESDHAEFRFVAAAALGRIGDPDAVPALLEVFDDPDVRVRTRAVRACGAIGDPRAIEALASRLADGYDQVSRSAAGALAAIGTEAAIDALAPAVHADNESVRVIAVEQLRKSKSLEVLPLLVEGLSDDADLVRRTATRSILELLATAPAERSHAVRNEVAAAVDAADPPDLLAQLRAILGGNQPRHVRRNAIWLFGQRLGSDAAADARACLLEALDDPDEIAAKVAMSTLVDLEGADLDEKLRAIVRDESTSDRARERAEFVLSKRRTVQHGPSREAVSNAVEFTYVSDPADYTATKRDRDGGSGNEPSE